MNQNGPSFLNPFEALTEKLHTFMKTNGLEAHHNLLNHWLKHTLTEMNFVSGEELDTQREVLSRLRENINLLEERLTALEKQQNPRISIQNP